MPWMMVICACVALVVLIVASWMVYRAVKFDRAARRDLNTKHTRGVNTAFITMALSRDPPPVDPPIEIPPGLYEEPGENR